MTNLTELTVLNDLQEIRILELHEQNRQLKAKCERLDEYDDLVDVNATLVEALEDALKFIHPLSSFMGKESVTEKKVKAALALAEGDKDG